MKVSYIPIEGIILLEPEVYHDERGYFFESYKKEVYESYGISTDFVQDNISGSIKGTIRGLHYQIGDFAQSKLCQVLYGEVLDVAVDLRKNSETFGKYISIILSAEKHNQIWIPEGFAHGFSVLSEYAIFHYKCTKPYNKDSERSLNFKDPELMIDWMVEKPLVSKKDREAIFLKNIGEDIF